MSTDPQELYIKRNPGDLVTADDWNDVQRKIKGDIGERIQQAIEAIEQVPESENALKLQGQSADELSESILEKARQELPKRTGYLRAFRRLRRGEDNIIEHNLGGYPLVDVYMLEPFPVVYSEDDQKEQGTAFFYIYHSSERRVRNPGGSGSVEIEQTGGAQFRIAFSDMLSYYRVGYNDNMTLEAVETNFWQAFLETPNDDFNDDEHGHSLWVDRNNGERRTIGQLKTSGDWPDIWFKVVPRKIVNPPFGGGQPFNVEVFHYDFNKLGLRFSPFDRERPPVSPPIIKEGTVEEPRDEVSVDKGRAALVFPFDSMAVMVLLKV